MEGAGSMRIMARKLMPEYSSWKKMRERCFSATCKDYPRYGGRGISICQRWNDFGLFLADMGARPSPSHSLGRIDNNIGYTNENCSWQTATEQARNRSTSRILSLNGESKTMAEWRDILGFNVGVLLGRVSRRNWTTERALTQIPRKVVRR